MTSWSLFNWRAASRNFAAALISKNSSVCCLVLVALGLAVHARHGVVPNGDVAQLLGVANRFTSMSRVGIEPTTYGLKVLWF